MNFPGRCPGNGGDRRCVRRIEKEEGFGGDMDIGLLAGRKRPFGIGQDFVFAEVYGMAPMAAGIADRCHLAVEDDLAGKRRLASRNEPARLGAEPGLNDAADKRPVEQGDGGSEIGCPPRQ
ncbi:hypothetical protein EV561_105149 [Rhizobium sp. BK376]|nr:hypothetical protein EV561_105149 [Rhizobium sp. BK376]